MQHLLYGVSALACPASMGAMMWWMARGKRSAPSGDAAETQRLRDELEMLRREQPTRR